MAAEILVVRGTKSLGGAEEDAVTERYCKPLKKRGMSVRVFRPEDGDIEDALADADGMLLTGGGDIDPALYDQEPHPKTAGIDPARDEMELDAVGYARAQAIPTMGLCRGCQMMAVAAGGDLVQHLLDESGMDHAQGARRCEVVHQVRLAPESRVAQAVGVTQLRANSCHHQGIADVGEGQVPVGWAEDDTIEALEAGEHPFWVGVHWHPEDLWDQHEHHARLFDAFCAAVQQEFDTRSAKKTTA